MTRKYTFAILLNCSQSDFGNHVNMEYLVVVIELVKPIVFLMPLLQICYFQGQ